MEKTDRTPDAASLAGRGGASRLVRAHHRSAKTELRTRASTGSTRSRWPYLIPGLNRYLCFLLLASILANTEEGPLFGPPFDLGFTFTPGIEACDGALGVPDIFDGRGHPDAQLDR